MGAEPSGAASRQTYQSAFALSRDELDSTNHACSSEVWSITRSSTIFMPRSPARAMSSSMSSIVPKEGSMAS